MGCRKFGVKLFCPAGLPRARGTEWDLAGGVPKLQRSVQIISFRESSVGNHTGGAAGHRKGGRQRSFAQVRGTNDKVPKY